MQKGQLERSSKEGFRRSGMPREMKCAAESIKKLRTESKAEWDGAKKIRKWRDAKK